MCDLVCTDLLCIESCNERSLNIVLAVDLLVAEVIAI